MDKYNLIITDSVGLPAKGRAGDFGCTYISRMSESGHLWILSRVGGLAGEFVDQLEQLSTVLPNKFFDAAVIQVGLADCAPRPATAHLMSQILKCPIVPLRNAGVRMLRHFRPQLQGWLKYYQRTTPRGFRFNMMRLIVRAKDLAKYTVVVTIPPVLDSVESRSPGMTKEINRYNGIILEVARIYRCHEIDMTERLMEAPDKYLTPDAHLTAWGLERVSAAVSGALALEWGKE